jgi:tetratricopeptide (TPR) repeat protein
LLWVLLTILLSAVASAWGQTPVPSVIAASSQPLRAGDRVIGTVPRGELLTVLAQNEENLCVQTGAGLKGWLARRHVVRLEDAESLCDELIRANPRAPENYERRALVWSSKGQTDKLLADYDRAIQLGSKNATVHSNRGIHWATAGQYERAIASYDRALALGLQEAHVYVNRGVARYAIGRYAEAVRDFDAAIQRGLGSAAVHINRAQALFAAGEDGRAADDLKEAVRLEPQNPTTHLECGKVWKTVGDFDRAIAEFDTAIRLNPQLTAAYANRGFAWFAKQEPQKAIADFDQVIRQDPQSAMAYNNRGYNRQLLGRYHEALADYERALQIAADYVLAHQNRAWLLATCPEASVRNGKEALAAAEKACALNHGKHWPDWKTLAAAYAELGLFEKAVEWQTKAAKEAPEEERGGEQQLVERYRAKQPHRFAPAQTGERQGPKHQPTRADR